MFLLVIQKGYFKLVIMSEQLQKAITGKNIEAKFLNISKQYFLLY